MKLKATITVGVPGELLEALNGIRARVYEGVLKTHLKVVYMGPAEFFVQVCDFTTETEDGFGCIVTLSQVSRTPRRAEQDFWDARATLEGIYQELLEKHLPLGTRTQLNVSLVLDSSVRDPNTGRDTTLVEKDAIWVEGTKGVKNSLEEAGFKTVGVRPPPVRRGERM